MHSKKAKFVSRNGRALLMLIVVVSACKREQRQFDPPPTTTNPAIVQSELQPGGAPQPQTSTKSPVEENANALSDGKRLFSLYNCTGCHANGGGAIGPALMDETWIYGSDPASIHSTIVEGRPNGMPSFRGKISDYQVWELSAYVRSLSGQLRKDVAPGRSDDMNVHRSEQRVERKTPQQSTIPKAAEQP
ncbi:MAG: cytochrome c oxidase cbb3-type subunit [Pyrinomonadaceae bacterium]|jgi:cytochrome c oxidase cbb3-type subunit 3|nr:cytochrome c oxidase cbb3-type subunit [Pyrinomonadaceae bacterium]